MEYQKEREEFETALKDMEGTQAAIKEWLDDISPYYETKTGEAGNSNPEGEQKTLEVYFAAVQIHYRNLSKKLTTFKENLKGFDKLSEDPKQALSYVHTLESILTDVNKILEDGSNALKNYRYHDKHWETFFD